jgi:hypothetical protein
MPSTLPNSSDRARLQSSEIRPRMAKVHTAAHRKTESVLAARAEIGACFERARCLAGLTLEQFADGLGRDASQVGKWIRNVEPPQVETILMSPFRPLFLQALAERTEGFEVEAVLTLRRRA